MKTQIRQIEPYRTIDGSWIRELMHPSQHGNAAQSLAHATIEPGASTRRHYHRDSEELYHITAGNCEVVLGNRVLQLEVGDTLLIPPGTHHHMRNTGRDSLELLCMCSPPYAHEDTFVVDDSCD